MTGLESAAPVTEGERRRVEHLNLIGGIAVALLLAGLHVGVVEVSGAASRPDAFPIVLIAYALAVAAWLTVTGRSLGYGGDPRRLSFRGRVGYRGARLSWPAMSITLFALSLSDTWEPAAVIVMVAGLVVTCAGFAAGATGRFPQLGPRPFREGWPAIGTGPLPHLYPGFVAHVVWLRRVRAKLSGGDPNRPLV